jgi:hypothetical protein
MSETVLPPGGAAGPRDDLVSAGSSGVGRLGIGLAAVARPAYITAGRNRDLGAHRTVEDLRARSRAVLDAAYAAGIRYVDVARSYGRAEEFLAGWLAAHPTFDDVVVGSKWGYRYVGEWRLDADVHEIKDHSLAAFERQSEESLALLGEYLAIYCGTVAPGSASPPPVPPRRTRCGGPSRCRSAAFRCSRPSRPPGTCSNPRPAPRSPRPRRPARA